MSPPPASIPSRAANFWDLIYQLSAAGHTIFVSTHYMDEAEYCHRLALMYRGSVIALGTPDELKESLGLAVDGRRVRRMIERRGEETAR